MTTGVHSRRQIRLYLPSPLDGERVIDLKPSQAHYLGGVLRLAADSLVHGFNEHDGEWSCRITSLGRGRGSLKVLQCTRSPLPEPGPHLLFAPIKKEAIDFVVEKATELGVARMTPILTRWTVVTRVNTARLRANAVEAAEQCGRLTIPIIDELCALDRAIADWPASRRLFVLDPRGGNSLIAGIKSAGEDGTKLRASPPAFLIGPEGGLESGELIGLTRHSFVTEVSLGPRILRAETAALAALACWQAIAGDWIDKGIEGQLATLN